jgi:catechol 2,3-dioxygenase-like lactoylglutathione lyase family enzyme
MTNIDETRVQNVDHVTMVVKDLSRTREFYVNLLGMEEVKRPQFGFPGLWFQAGNTQIHVNLESDEAGRAGVSGHGTKVLARGHHFAFVVSDAMATAARLTQLGIRIVDGPTNRPDGAVQFYVHDPDGHLVELFTPPKVELFTPPKKEP